MEIKRPAAVKPSWCWHIESVVLQALIDRIDLLLARLREADMKAFGIPGFSLRA
jgi:hypothetical protein